MRFFKHTWFLRSYIVLAISALLLNMATLAGSTEGVLSPSFVRDEITDNGRDWWDNTHKKWYENESSPHDELSAVTFFSDGKVLNATIFLGSQFVAEPTNYIPGYGILINVDFNNEPETGIRGWDYMMRITWNNITKVWTYTLQEMSKNGSRIIERIPNGVNQEYTSFLPEGENESSVYLSLDLGKVSYPQQYQLAFFVDYDFRNEGTLTELVDFSSLVYVPPPRYSLIIPSGSITLLPGKEKIIEVQLNSSYPISGANVNLFVDEDESIKNGINSTFEPNEMEIPVHTIPTSDLHLTALNDTEMSFTLPLYAIISFPVQYLPGISTSLITMDEPLPPLSLPIKVDPLTFEEHFTVFWATYGGAISLIGGGFAAGFASLVFTKFRKKPSTTDNNDKN